MWDFGHEFLSMPEGAQGNHALWSVREHENCTIYAWMQEEVYCSDETKDMKDSLSLFFDDHEALAAYMYCKSDNEKPGSPRAQTWARSPPSAWARTARATIHINCSVKTWGDYRRADVSLNNVNACKAGTEVPDPALVDVPLRASVNEIPSFVHCHSWYGCYCAVESVRRNRYLLHMMGRSQVRNGDLFHGW